MSDNSNFDPLSGGTNNNSSNRLKGFMDYFLIIRDRWLFGLALAIPFSIFFAYNKLKEPPMYASTASMMLEPSKQILNMAKVVRNDYSAAILGLHLEHMKSKSLKENVTATISKKPKEKEALLQPYLKDLKPEDPKPTVASKIQYSVSLSGQGAPIVSVHAVSRSGEGAAIIANTVVKEYLKIISEKSSSSYDSAIAFLEEQSEEMRQKEMEAEEALKSYRKKHNLASMDDNKAFIVTRISSMNGVVTSARVRKLGIQTQLQQIMAFKLANKDIFELSSVGNFGNIKSLRGTLVELMEMHNKLKERYLERHPAMIENLKRIESVNDLLEMEVELAISDLKNTRKMAEAEEMEFKNERKKAQLEAAKLDDLSIQYNVYERQREVYKKTYNTLINRLTEARITSQLENQNFKFHNTAFPGGQISPDRRDITSKAIGIFFVIFIAIPLALEFIDNRIKSPWDIEVFLGRDLLAGIPRISAVKEAERPLIVGNDLDEGLVESFRSLYSRIQMQSETSGARSILVTSAIPSEGKSLIAANLAYTFANHGRRTILVDFDLRRPGIHKFCGLENEIGMLTLVEEYESLPIGVETLNIDGALNEVFPNLFILPSGGRTRSATELLEKPAFDAVIAMLKRQCDVLIMDTSPVGLFPDSLALAQKTDELIYVTRFGKVSRKVCKSLLNSLEETGVRILGVVLNDLPEKKAHGYYYYGGYYGYGYYRYKYYNKYYGEDQQDESSKVKEITT